ncbi:unnamed protein product [Allacma fusca]|uniref:Decaprenyl-diphosphate synthase subunit 2 n=1 Tax=Allacma fusca TaxID=39272 RepID=A0A8J2PAX6_9HEXA|nr:unnamed protein product [Allacma fusca]
MGASFRKIHTMPLSSIQKNYYCSDRNVQQHLRNSWKSVLESASKVGFSCSESSKLLKDASKPLSENFLNGFHKKHPFVQHLYEIGLELHHPVGRFAMMESHEYLVLPVAILLIGRLLCESGDDKISKLEERQLSFSKAVLAIYLSQKIHATIRDSNAIRIHDVENRVGSSKIDEEGNALSKGNKIATLVGDLLITEMYLQLSHVGSNRVVQIMSDLLANCSQESFSKQATVSQWKENSPKNQYVWQSFPTQRFLQIFFIKSLESLSILIDEDPRHEKTAQLNHLGNLLGELYYTHQHFYSRICYGKNSSDKNPTYRFNDNTPKTDEIKMIVQNLNWVATPSVKVAFNSLVDFLSIHD